MLTEQRKVSRTGTTVLTEQQRKDGIELCCGFVREAFENPDKHKVLIEQCVSEQGAEIIRLEIVEQI
jgi:hypothetical protein